MRLAGATFAALLATTAYALPHFQSNAVIARSADPEDIAEALAESAKLLARSLDIDKGDKPKHKRVCEKTDNAAWGVYPEHEYSPNQMYAAFIAAAKLNADDKQIGANKYPHQFHNAQAFPSGCGSNAQEFPILMDNTIYDGGSVASVPDRLMYELSIKPKKIVVKFCAVIRHGPDDRFLDCPKP